LKIKVTNLLLKNLDKIVLSGQTPVFIEDSVDYIDLNYQPYYKDPKMKSVIIKSRDSVEIVRNTLNIPCICVGISINGSNLWAEGVGYSDIENGVKCHKHTSMRLASISKPITSILVGLLIESGKLELDVNINEYLSIEQFPKKRYNNKEFNITLRQLMSHTAGIRESKYEDFTTIHNFTNITQTLSLFANDDLIAEPGTKFHYSNPSWNLVGAIIESVLNETFDIAINSMLNQALGMLSSSAEKQEIIVPYKAKYYQKNNLTHELENSDFIDDISASIEKWWPSGGILSTVGDLLHFGNSVIKSYEQSYGNIKTQYFIPLNNLFFVLKIQYSKHRQ
jgi:serine beta-lactamase-like protein LACTB